MAAWCCWYHSPGRVSSATGNAPSHQYLLFSAFHMEKEGPGSSQGLCPHCPLSTKEGALRGVSCCCFRLQNPPCCSSMSCWWHRLCSVLILYLKSCVKGQLEKCSACIRYRAGKVPGTAVSASIAPQSWSRLKSAHIHHKASKNTWVLFSPSYPSLLCCILLSPWSVLFSVSDSVENHLLWCPVKSRRKRALTSVLWLCLFFSSLGDLFHDSCWSVYRKFDS